MSLKANAEQLWTRLLSAMREDGVIAHCVTQSGPATTQVIVDVVQQATRPWIPMHMKPTPGREVVALSQAGTLIILRWSVPEFPNVWVDHSNLTYGDECFKAYTFVDTKGAPQ